jgi:ABC-2 type transport system ATP-binding protein
MTAAIRTEGLSKTYLSGFFRRPFVGLRDLTMEVPEGATFGFVGPNGAGKTTTIKTLMGIQRATSGRAFIHGLPIENPESRRRVGFMPERPYFYEHLSAGEFLDFYARLTEVPASERAGRISTLLERVGLSKFRSVPLGKFSKGMLQRAGIAQALINDPALVVLDEPMSGLDPLGRVLVRDIIEEEHRKGKTVFFSSHILSDVQALCSQVAIVVAGELRGIGAVSDLLRETIHEVECTFRYAGAPPGVVVRREEDRITVRVAAEAVDATIDAVRAQGGSVIAVHPLARSLEDVLLTEVERAKAVNEARLGVLA